MCPTDCCISNGIHFQWKQIFSFSNQNKSKQMRNAKWIVNIKHQTIEIKIKCCKLFKFMIIVDRFIVWLFLLFSNGNIVEFDSINTIACDSRLNYWIQCTKWFLYLFHSFLLHELRMNCAVFFPYIKRKCAFILPSIFSNQGVECPFENNRMPINQHINGFYGCFVQIKVLLFVFPLKSKNKRWKACDAQFVLSSTTMAFTNSITNDQIKMIIIIVVIHLNASPMWLIETVKMSNLCYYYFFFSKIFYD